jgi:hypothetical protein
MYTPNYFQSCQITVEAGKLAEVYQLVGFCGSKTIQTDACYALTVETEVNGPQRSIIIEEVIDFYIEFIGCRLILASQLFWVDFDQFRSEFCFLGSSKNLLELKIKPPLSNLACLNVWDTL